MGPQAGAQKANPLKPGPLIAAYHVRPLHKGERIRLVLIGGLAFLAPLVYGYYRMQYASAKYGPVAAQHWSRPWFLLAGTASVLFLILVVYRVISARQRIQVHQNALIQTLSRHKPLYWNEISGISVGASRLHFLGLPLREVQQAWLYPAVGRAVPLNASVENLPELLTRLKAILYPRLLPELQRAFDAGRRVYFGSIAVSSSYLRLEPNRNPVPGESAPRDIPWNQVQHIAVQSGALVITLEEGDPIRMPVAKIPNLELLLQIIQSGVKR